MFRTVDLIILFKELNLLSSQRTRIIVLGSLVRNEPVEAWLARVGNWHVWRLRWILRLLKNVQLRRSLLSLLTLEHLHDLIKFLFNFSYIRILLLNLDLMLLNFCLKVSDAVVTSDIFFGDILQTLRTLNKYPRAGVKMLTILRSHELVCASIGSTLYLNAKAFILKMSLQFLIGN